MKHSPIRKNKTCLNCGAKVPDRYCSHCGQENTEPKESFRHLLSHFFADVTHYDSQFFSTIKYLIFKPGFLTLEYNAGKRLSYLNPIRLYIFVSAIFFLVMFSKKKEQSANTYNVPKQEVNIFRQHFADSLRKVVKPHSKLVKDSVRKDIYTQLATTLDTPKMPVSKEESLGVAFNNSGDVVFKMRDDKYSSIPEYEAAQRKLADTAKYDFISRYIVKKIIRLNRQRGHKGELVITQNMGHNIPKIMFILLPLFALFVGMLYGLYKRKKYLYSQHAIFSLHFHSFVFITFLVLYLINLFNFGVTVWIGIISAVLLGIFLYLVMALSKAYEEKFWISLAKALVISVCYNITLIICMCIVFVIAFIFI